MNSGNAEISFVIILKTMGIVKRNIRIFPDFFGDPILGTQKLGEFAVGFGKKALLFTVGGLGYVGLELLWRGRSHQSMFLAGGSCFLLLGQLGKRTRLAPVRALGGAGIITGVELVVGLMANRNHGVWDYRSMPLNFKGQICLCYSLLWVPLSLCAIAAYELLDQKISR